MITREGYFGTFLNVVLVACGPILLSFGFYMAYYYLMFKPFVDPLVWIIPLVIASVGLLSIIVAIFGFCGGAFSHPIIYFTFVFVTVAASIVIGSYWVNAEDNSPEFIYGHMEKAYRQYDRLDQKYLWRKLHRKFECCGVNGAIDFQSSGRTIPTECYNRPIYVKSGFVSRGFNPEIKFRDINSTNSPSIPTTSQTDPPNPAIVDTGCSNALTKRLVLDRVIIGSVACTAGLLTLLLLVASFFMNFQEGNAKNRDYGAADMENDDEDDAYEMDDFYDCCNVPPQQPCVENFYHRNTSCRNYNQPAQQHQRPTNFCVPNSDPQQTKQTIVVSCDYDPPPPPACVPQYYPNQVRCVNPSVPQPGVYMNTLPPSGIPGQTAPGPGGQVCMVVIPPNPNGQVVPTATGMDNVLSSMQQQHRPIQLQIPDMGFLASIMPNRSRSRHRRHRRRRDTDRPMSIIPVPSVNGFMVCNTQRDDSDESY